MSTMKRRPREVIRLIDSNAKESENNIIKELLTGEAFDIKALSRRCKLDQTEVLEVLAALSDKNMINTMYSLKKPEVERKFDLPVDLSFKPKISDSIVSAEVTEGVVLTSKWNERLIVSPDEWEVIKRFDGKSTVKEILRKLVDDNIYVFPSLASGLILKLENIGALDNYARTIFKSRESVVEKIFKNLEITLLEWKYKSDSPGFLEKFSKLIGFIYSWPSYIGSIAFLIVGFLVLFQTKNGFSAKSIMPTWHYIITGYAVMTISVMFHETGHFLSLLSLGGKPASASLRLYNFVHLAVVVDSSDAWSLNRPERIKVLLAGIQAHGFICMLAAGAYYLFALDGAVEIICRQIIFINFLTAISNLLLVIFRTDGYFILAQLLNINHLRKKCFAVVFPSMRKNINIPGSLSFKIFAWLYVILSILFIIYGFYNVVMFFL